MRVTTAFKRLMDLPGVTVTEVDFQPSQGGGDGEAAQRDACAARSAGSRPRPATTPGRSPPPGATSTSAAGASRSEPTCAGSPARPTACAPRACPSPGRARASPGTSRTWSAGWPPPWTRPPSAACVRIDWDDRRAHHRTGDGDRARSQPPRQALRRRRRRGLLAQGPLVSHPGLEPRHGQVRLGQGGQGHSHAGLLLRRARRGALRGDHRHVDGHGPRLREVGDGTQATPPRRSSATTRFMSSSSSPPPSTRSAERSGRTCASSPTTTRPGGSRAPGGRCSRTPPT